VPYHDLASYKRFETHLATNWPTFSAKRSERLRQQGRFGEASERVTENIVEDLFTVALDWKLGDINNQVDYADIVVTRLGIKYCIVETKRPGALAWNRAAVHNALEQARRYADEQKVTCIAVSDGVMFYAANIERGGLHDRIFVSLESKEPHNDLWWLSEHGVYRPRIGPQDEPLTLLKQHLSQKQSARKRIQLRCFIQNIACLHSALRTSEMRIAPQLGNYPICQRMATLT
jgi:hypothetical protein